MPSEVNRSKPMPINDHSPEPRPARGPAFYPLPAAGALRIAGPDQRDFLQRQTTNDVALLAEDRPLVTVLTSPTARVLDVLTLVQTAHPDTGDPEILALTLSGRAEATAAFLRGKIFFMDNVTVADASADHRQIELLSMEGSAGLKSLGFAATRTDSGLASATFEGSPVILLSVANWPDRLLAPSAVAPALVAQLEALGLAPLDEAAYEIRRVEAGRPGPQVELTGDYTPLENNLAWAVSTTKGCYTGQEVIARQITYDKITRKLVGVRVASEITAGDRVWAGNQAAGIVTSAALSPAHGPIALAMIKRPHFEPGNQVTVGDPDSGTPGAIAPLPFTEEIGSDDGPRD